jgi:hypothetical protein
VASQFEDLLDRTPVCLQQVNCGHERIVVGSKDDEDTLVYSTRQRKQNKEE